MVLLRVREESGQLTDRSGNVRPHGVAEVEEAAHELRVALRARVLVAGLLVSGVRLHGRAHWGRYVAVAGRELVIGQEASITWEVEFEEQGTTVALLGSLCVVGTVAPTRTDTTKPAPSVSPRRRLFVSERGALALNLNGYERFSVGSLDLIETQTSGQFGWKYLIETDSGIAIGCVGSSSVADSAHRVELYDMSKPLADGFITRFQTLNIAHSVVLYNGLVYAAVGTEGLAIINPRPFDNKGASPSIRVEAGQFIEGGISLISAHVQDDVMIKSVQFFVDGELVATDGNPPL